MTWWYLSFADVTRPKGQHFLGACIVQGDDIVEAAREAHVRGCNPGGQVLGAPYPDDVPTPEPRWRYRLLSKAAIAEMDGVAVDELMTLGDLGIQVDGTCALSGKPKP